MKTVAALAALAGIAGLAQADVLANWTFETSVPTTAGPHLAELGVNAATSNASGSHAGAAVYSNPAGNGSAESFSSNTWTVGDYYQFTTSTAGYQNVSIAWDQTSSNTGPGHFQVEVSTDGLLFSPIGGVYTVLANGTPNPAWSSGTNQPVYSFTLGGLGLDNQANVWIRLTNTDTVAANSTSPVATAGTNRVDNVIISGDVVPAPASIALVGLAGLVAGRRRR